MYSAQILNERIPREIKPVLVIIIVKSLKKLTKKYELSEYNGV